MIKKVVDKLTALGYLESIVGNASPIEELRSYSMFCATDKLMTVFPESEVEYFKKSYRNSLVTVILKDADGNLVDYKDTRFTNKADRTTKLINSINSVHDFVFKGEYLSNDALVRIFNRTFDKGGRFYRTDVQSIKQRDEKGNKLDIQETRLGLTIDGEHVVECDYGALHPYIICAMNGIDAKRFSGDIYEDLLPVNYVAQDRNLFKKALLIMFNSTKRDKAISAVQKEINFSGGVYSFKSGIDVITMIEEKLPEFEDFFYREDSFGLTLQNIDSRIMDEIIL